MKNLSYGCVLNDQRYNTNMSDKNTRYPTQIVHTSDILSGNEKGKKKDFLYTGTGYEWVESTVY